MTPDDISFWSMIGTWFSGVATAMAVVISLWLASYTRKAKLSIEIKMSKYGEATFKIINTSNIIATIESITLSTSKHSILMDRRGDNFIDYALQFKSDDELVNALTIPPNGYHKELDIDFTYLKYSYHKFLPYDQDMNLTKVVKMPTAYVLVQIVGGQTFHSKLPPIFFARYKNDDCLRLEEMLKKVTERPELYISFNNDSERNERQLERLDMYMKSKRNSLFLIE